jgi:hypothetical protein
MIQIYKESNYDKYYSVNLNDEANRLSILFKTDLAENTAEFTEWTSTKYIVSAFELYAQKKN